MSSSAPPPRARRTASWTFNANGANGNYNTKTDSVTITINKAEATVNVNGDTYIYDGKAHGATGTAKGVNGEDLSSLLNLGDSFTNVPGGTATWSFAGNGNYKPASGTASIVITKATQTITFGTLTNKTLADKSFAVSATGGGSGNAVTFSVENSTGICSVSGNTVSILGVGKCTIVASQAGNTNYEAATNKASVYITYGSAYSGLLAPINITGTRSSFKLGSTIPVKFKLTAPDGTAIANTVNKLVVSKVNNTPEVAVNESLYSDTPTTGNTFRYDSTGAQYIFNLSTKNVHTNPDGSTVTFTAGTWYLKVQLSDGTVQTTTIDIQK